MDSDAIGKEAHPYLDNRPGQYRLGTQRIDVMGGRT